MNWFSERQGFKPIRESLQIDDLDTNTRRRIWNLLSQYFFSDARYKTFKNYSNDCKRLTRAIWDNYFKWTHDHLVSAGWNEVYEILRKKVIEEDWYKAYDIIEVVIKYSSNQARIHSFIQECNQLLEKEMCEYRIMSLLVVPISSPSEIKAIEDAITTPFQALNKHIESALGLFSSRTTPNFPNSVKEAISAVECACRIVLVDENVTLGKALKRLEKGGVPIHGAFEKGVSALYGWTSSDAGIRHARINDSEIGFEEAKLMLVLCSSFVNYLINKAEKAGINLQSNYEAIK